MSREQPCLVPGNIPLVIETDHNNRKDHYLQLGEHLVALLKQSSSVSDELINDSLGGLLLVNDGGDLAHQERTGVVKSFVVHIVGQVLKIVLDGNDTLGSKLLDLLGTVLLPVHDVGVLANTQGTALYRM